MTHRTERLICAVSLLDGHAVLDDVGRPVALCLDAVTAARVASLLDAYGVCDVPDTVAGIEGT